MFLNIFIIGCLIASIFYFGKFGLMLLGFAGPKGGWYLSTAIGAWIVLFIILLFFKLVFGI